MPGPYPLPTLAPTINAAGISAPSYADILASYQASYRNIYGQDTYLAADSQDGEWLALLASDRDDENQAIIDVYNSFSPATAQGAGLSSNVKINGLRRQASTFSTTPVLIVGVAGTLIASGIVLDQFNNQWTLPPNVVIPYGGAITATATCVVPGAIAAPPGTITQIVTIVRGWQTVVNTASAAPGDPVESDGALRVRQAASTALPAQTPMQSIIANVAELNGVTRYAIYNNSGSNVDGNGVPGHSIAVVVEGGDVVEIAQVISEKKNPGTGTFGSTTEIIIDPSGVPDTINFFVLGYVPIYFAITIRPLIGYVSTTGQLAVQSIAAAIGGLNIGSTVYFNRVWSAANLSGDAALSVAGGLTQPQLDQLSVTYNIISLYTGLGSNPNTMTDIPIPFSSVAQCPASNGILTTL